MNALAVTFLLVIVGITCSQQCSQEDSMKVLQCVTKFTEQGSKSNQGDVCKLYKDFRACTDKASGCKSSIEKAFENVEKMMKEQGFDCGSAGMVRVSLFSLVVVFLATYFIR